MDVPRSCAFIYGWCALRAGIGCAVVGMYPFPHTSLSVMLVFYALSSLALIAFSYFLSTLFSTQRVAGFATIVFFAAAMLPG